MSDLFFLLVFIILATAFAVASVVAALIVGYKSEDVDTAPYECGMKLFGGAKIKFNIKFLNFAVLFLIFDIETIFLFPFAVVLSEMEIFVYLEVILFISILLFALFYAIKKNILRWQ